MSSPHDQDRVLDMLLAGTPDRVIDALEGPTAEARAEIDALHEALAMVGLSLPAVPPSPGLRDRVADMIARAEAPSRRAALLVVDMQRDHLTPGAPLYVPRAVDIVPAMRARLDEARAAGEPVIYVVDHHDTGDPELDVWPEHNTGAPRDDVWPELAPRPGELVVTHRAYSGFHETALDGVLRSLDVNTVVVTGCITEIHLFATATDALQRGYRVEVPKATQAGASALVEEVILGTLSVMVPVKPLSATA